MRWRISGAAMLRSLPPIFARVRGGLPRERLPPVVVSVGHERLKHAAIYLGALNDGDDDVRKRFHVESSLWFDQPQWDHVWFEIPQAGMLMWRGDLYHFSRGELKPVRVKTEGRESHEPWEAIRLAQLYQVTTAIYLEAERPADVSVNTFTRNAPRQFVRQGDTLRYAPLSSLASSAGQSRQREYAPPEESSGIRMREHDVRGHWRTYSSGVRVWVRSHKRGDPDLGRVTRVIGDG